MSDSKAINRGLVSRNPFQVSEGTDATAADHDDAVDPTQADMGRRNLRVEIGKFVSLARFPASAGELMRIAADNQAPPKVMSHLQRLDPAATSTDNRDLWHALGLGAGGRL